MRERDLTSSQKREISKVIVMSMMLFVWIFMFVIVSFLTAFIFIIFTIPLLISFILKFPYKIILSLFKKEKINSKIFAKNKFENFCIKGIKYSGETFNNGMGRIGKEIKNADKMNQRRPSPLTPTGDYLEGEKGFCVICGNQLKTRRKYCSYCKPSGKATPSGYRYKKKQSFRKGLDNVFGFSKFKR